MLVHNHSDALALVGHWCRVSHQVACSAASSCTQMPIKHARLQHEAKKLEQKEVGNRPDSSESELVERRDLLKVDQNFEGQVPQQAARHGGTLAEVRVPPLRGSQGAWRAVQQRPQVLHSRACMKLACDVGTFARFACTYASRQRRLNHNTTNLMQSNEP